MSKSSDQIPENHRKNNRPFIIGITLLVILYTVGVVLMTARAINRANIFTKQEVAYSLATVLATTNEALDLWLNQQQERIEIVRLSPMLIEATQQLLDISRNQSTLRSHQAQSDLREYIEPILARYGQVDFVVISPDSINLASMSDSNVGTQNLIAEQRPELLARVFQGDITLIPPVNPNDMQVDTSGDRQNPWLPTMYIAGPIENSAGQVIAALALQIDPSADFSRITQLGRLGESGETYAFDINGFMMTESRFADQLLDIGLLESGEHSINNIRIADPGVNLLEKNEAGLPADERPLTLMASEAIQGNFGVNVDGYRDYRGVPVFGAWLWSEDLDVGLTTEIDAEEAMLPYSRTFVSSMVLVAATLTVSLLLAGGLVYNRTRLGRAIETAYFAQQSSEQQNRAVLDNIIDAVISINEGGLIASFNRAAEETFGYTAEEVLGRNVRMLMPEPDHSRHDNYLENYLNTGKKKIIGVGREVTGVRKDGSQFPMYLGLSENLNSGERLFTSVIRDITLRREAEMAIQDARNAAESASLAKSEFLSNVSHELRTPLNSLMSVAFLAEETGLSSIQLELIDKMKSATNKLKSIIDTMLDFSSLQNGELEMEMAPFDIRNLITGLSDEYSPKAYEKGLAIKFNISPAVPTNLIGDPDRIRQVLSLLTDNAIKFTEEGEGELFLDRLDEQGTTVTLKVSVRDTGIGMTEDEIYELFQPFTQLDGSSTRRYGGLGMGLILSKQIVEKMGGEIFVKSKPGEGSIISFTLEFERAPEEGPTNDPSTKVSSEIPGEETIPQAEEEDLTPVFRELVHQLREKEAQALNTVNHIRKRLTSPQFQPDMKQLERLITLYEFDEAIEMLTQLSEELGIEIKDDQTLSD